MDLKAVAVLFCLSAFTISSSEAGIPRCCISTRKNISPAVLAKVIGFTLQKSGACDINAVILHFHDKRRRMCVDLTAFKELVASGEKWMMKNKKNKVQKRAAKSNMSKHSVSSGTS